MSYNGHAVVDMDSHIRQYWDLDRTYKANIAPAYRETYLQFSAASAAARRRPGDRGFSEFLWPTLPSRPFGVHDRYETANHDGDPLSRSATSKGVEIDPACNWDPSVRLRDMDLASVDVSVVFPSSSDSFCALRDVGFESALHAAFHRYMSGYCSEGNGRLLWVGVATMRDISEAITQLEYWASADRNFAGLQIPRACPDGTMLDNPSLHRLYLASQTLDLPLWVHGGAGRPPFTPWPDAPNAIYHAIGGQYALTSLIGGGVFDLFPTLRIGLFESFGGWMPYLVEKLDDGLRPGSAAAPRMKRSASEVVADGNLFCSIEPDEKHIAYAVQELGNHPWLFSTDYPHSGSAWPQGVSLLAENPMPEAAKRALFADNAARFLPRVKNGFSE